LIKILTQGKTLQYKRTEAM